MRGGAQVLGRHGHLVQLNAAGRQVAADRGWALVDFEAMAHWFAQPKVRTWDVGPQVSGP